MMMVSFIDYFLINTFYCDIGFTKTLIYLGYMKITDLGIARVWNPDNAKDTSGTPGYMGNTTFIIIMFI
jgi:hypothetical protein